MKKKSVIWVALFLLPYTMFCQISFLYDSQQDSLIKMVKYDERDAGYTLGIPSCGIEILYVNKENTCCLYKSFGCTQYHFQGNILTFYIWANVFYDSDCLCIGDDESPCRPDTNAADLKITYSFMPRGVKCSISQLPYTAILSYSSKAAKDSLETMDCTKLIKLNGCNKFFRQKKYNHSYKLSRFLVDYYYDIFFLNVNAAISSNINVNLLKKNFLYMMKKERIKEDSYLFQNYLYVKDLITYIKPLSGRVISDDEVWQFSMNVRKLRCK